MCSQTSTKNGSKSQHVSGKDDGEQRFAPTRGERVWSRAGQWWSVGGRLIDGLGLNWSEIALTTLIPFNGQPQGLSIVKVLPVL